LQCADLAAAQLERSQTAVADQFGELNKIVIGAEANLIARQLGLLGSLPRLVGVNSGA